MFDPDGQFQQALLSALSIETGHLVVGFNSSQMDFKGVIFQPNYNNNPNDFRNTAGTLDHFTINGNETVRTWNISAKSNTLNSSYAYYVYAKCPIVGDDGEILVTTEKITVTQVANYYHFFLGILNTPRTDTGITTRSWKPVFGFTEISGSDIVTGVIRDRLSRIIIDLVNGTIYGKMTFAAGSTGYSNITDKPDIDGITLDVKNQIALRIGYANWADMVNKATAGNTVIVGGLINTEIIDAMAIFTDALVVEKIASIAGSTFTNEQARIETQRGLTVTNGTVELGIHPSYIPDLSSFISANAAISGQVNLPASTQSISSGASGQFTVNGTSSQSLTSVSRVTWSAFTIGGTVNVIRDAGQTTTGCSMTISVYAVTTSGSTESEILMGTVSGSSQSDYLSFSGTIQAGSASISSSATSIKLRLKANAVRIAELPNLTPSANVTTTALTARSLFSSTGGVKKSALHIDGYGVALNSTNYFHLKAGTSMVLNFKGAVGNGSAIPGLLLSLRVGSRSTSDKTGIWGLGGMLRDSFSIVESTSNREITINHNYGSNYYIVFAFCQIADGKVFAAETAHNTNSFTIKCFGYSGSSWSDTLNPIVNIIMLSI